MEVLRGADLLEIAGGVHLETRLGRKVRGRDEGRGFARAPGMDFGEDVEEQRGADERQDDAADEDQHHAVDELGVKIVAAMRAGRGAGGFAERAHTTTSFAAGRRGSCSGRSGAAERWRR